MKFSDLTDDNQWLTELYLSNSISNMPYICRIRLDYEKWFDNLDESDQRQQCPFLFADISSTSANADGSESIFRSVVDLKAKGLKKITLLYCNYYGEKWLEEGRLEPKDFKIDRAIWKELEQAGLQLLNGSCKWAFSDCEIVMDMEEMSIISQVESLVPELAKRLSIKIIPDADWSELLSKSVVDLKAKGMTKLSAGFRSGFDRCGIDRLWWEPDEFRLDRGIQKELANAVLKTIISGCAWGGNEGSMSVDLKTMSIDFHEESLVRDPAQDLRFKILPDGGIVKEE